MDALIKTVASRRRAIPLGPPIRVRCALGEGAVRYFVNDGWIGIHLDRDWNPRRVDEIRAEHCTIAEPGAEPADIVPPAMPCDHTACSGRCDALTGERGEGE